MASNYSISTVRGNKVQIVEVATMQLHLVPAYFDTSSQNRDMLSLVQNGNQHENEKGG